MSTTGAFPATPGVGQNAALYTFLEDAITKFLQRVALNDANGVDAMGLVGDAAWTSGNGALIPLLKAIATALAAIKADSDSLVTVANSTTPSTVEVTNPSYEAVAASASAQVMGASGAAGDILSHVLIIPATTSPGAVSIQDGAGSAITIFAGGASSVTSLIPFAVPLGIIAVTNWKITTGANVSAVGVGKFS